LLRQSLLYERPRLDRALTEVRTLRRKVAGVLLTASAQASIQLLGLATGLAAVRLLPVRQYAYYTIANAVLGMMSVLSDSGIADSLIAQGGKVWRDRQGLGGLVAAGLSLRKRFGLLAAALALPILYALLRRQGATPLTAVLVAATIVPVFASTLTGQLLQIVPRLHQQSTRLQGIQVTAAVMRFALVTGAAMQLPLAWITNICAGVAQGWANWRLRRLAGALADLDAPPEPDRWEACVRQVRRSAPSALYYAFEGQIAVLLVSIFGRTSGVASVGALTRLAMIFTVISSVFALIWVPRFARLPHGRAMLKAFWGSQLALGGVALIPVLCVALFPRAVLWVLGPAYGALSHEALIAALGGSCGLLGGCAYWMAAARGVVIAPWLMIPLGLGVQIVLISILPLSTVSGVLWLGALTNLAYWIMHSFNFTRAPR
jgi:O-antigen/teichoic acid export membrane protein